MRIVVRAADVRVARDAQARLAAAGVDAVALPGARRPAPNGEDMSIVVAGNADEGRELVGEVGVPFATLLGCRNGAIPTASGSPFMGAVSLDAPPKLLRAQIDAWLRVAVAVEERERRTATAVALGVSPIEPAPVRKTKALYIGAPAPIFLALEKELSQEGGLVAAAFSSFAGFDHLHDEPFDAVLLNGAQDPATAISLCAALRRNAALHHLPTLMLTKPGDTATADAAIDRGASAICDLSEPCQASLAWLMEAVRRERRRRAAETEIRALRDVMGEARTGLWRRAAFDAHLARLASDHHASGRPLALVALRMTPAIGAREPSEAAWRKGFTEIASLAARLMRDADSGVAIGADVITVALPASPLLSAKRTAERIAAVAECTAFAAGEGDIGPIVFEQSTVELQPGESGAAMLARALRAIEAESVPA